MAIRREIELEEGWPSILKAVIKLIRILEGEPEPEFETDQYIKVYTTVYSMCSQKSDYSEEFYDRYRKIIEDYLREKVLPSLREKHGEYLLRELVKRWDNHEIMVKWLERFFHYVDRYYVSRRGLPRLRVVGLTCFRDLVYSEVQRTAKEAVLALIHEEREGEVIDKALLKNVLDVYVENGMGTMESYQEDFESFMLEDTATYYSRKASSWIQEDTSPDYMLKSEECLKKERQRVTNYLHSSTEPKLVEKVQNELLVVVAKQLLENEHSGCCALLRDDKMDDLSTMYRLFRPITQGLEPVADLFKQHITAEGNALIEQVLDASVNIQQINQVLIKKVIELHDKYMVYVTQCFQNHTLFHKALEEAFETICNKTVAGISSVELLETFCDNSLKKGEGGTPKLE